MSTEWQIYSFVHSKRAMSRSFSSWALVCSLSLTKKIWPQRMTLTVNSTVTLKVKSYTDERPFDLLTFALSV